jgi:glycine cleavage system transcriptional repressor
MMSTACNRTLSSIQPFLVQQFKNSSRSSFAAAAVTSSKVFFSTNEHEPKTHLLVNALGVDRLGIVSDMTKIVTGVGGSVGDSQASRLGTHFSITMRISIPITSVEQVKSSFEHEISDMSTNIMEVGDPDAKQVVPEIGYKGYFTLEGADQPGHVHKVTSLLSKHGLSIDSMETSEEEAPFGGTTLYRIEGTVSARKPLAKGFNPDSIRDDFDSLGDNLNCDVSLEDQTNSALSYTAA